MLPYWNKYLTVAETTEINVTSAKQGINHRFANALHYRTPATPLFHNHCHYFTSKRHWNYVKVIATSLIIMCIELYTVANIFDLVFVIQLNFHLLQSKQLNYNIVICHIILLYVISITSFHQKTASTVIGVF